jgi:hypothetical protein
MDLQARAYYHVQVAGPNVRYLQAAVPLCNGGSSLDGNADEARGKMSTGMESMAVRTVRAPILEDWTASCIRLWKVKHVSYLTTVRTQQAQDLDVVALRAVVMLGPKIRYCLQEFISLGRSNRRH